MLSESVLDRHLAFDVCRVVEGWGTVVQETICSDGSARGAVKAPRASKEEDCSEQSMVEAAMKGRAPGEAWSWMEVPPREPPLAATLKAVSNAPVCTTD